MDNYTTEFSVSTIISEEDPHFVLSHTEHVPCGGMGISQAEFEQTCEHIRENLIDLLNFIPWKITISAVGETKEFYDEELLETNAASVQTGDVISFSVGGPKYNVGYSYLNEKNNTVAIWVESGDLDTYLLLPREVTVIIHR